MPCTNCGKNDHNRPSCSNHRICFNNFKCGCKRCWAAMNNEERQQWKKESTKRYSKNYINNIWNQRNQHNYNIISVEWRQVIRGPTNNPSRNFIYREGRQARITVTDIPRIIISLNINNQLTHPCVCYWMIERNDTKDYSECKRFMNVDSLSTARARIYDIKTTIIVVKNFSELTTNMYYTDIKNFILKEFLITSIPTNSTIILKDDMEKWKESTLKLNFLIEQLKRLGIHKNDNYSSIIDMHEDIIIPTHSELDKENAGIPSTLTNIT